jgi:hypothetical protein
MLERRKHYLVERLESHCLRIREALRKNGFILVGNLGLSLNCASKRIEKKEILAKYKKTSQTSELIEFEKDENNNFSYLTLGTWVDFLVISAIIPLKTIPWKGRTAYQ